MRLSPIIGEYIFNQKERNLRQQTRLTLFLNYDITILYYLDTVNVVTVALNSKATNIVYLALLLAEERSLVMDIQTLVNSFVRFDIFQT